METISLIKTTHTKVEAFQKHVAQNFQGNTTDSKHISPGVATPVGDGQGAVLIDTFSFRLEPRLLMFAQHNPQWC